MLVNPYPPPHKEDWPITVGLSVVVMVLAALVIGLMAHWLPATG